MLFPIRIDVTLNNNNNDQQNNTRVVDTLLFDYDDLANTTTPAMIARDWAYSVLADQQVVSVTRQQRTHPASTTTASAATASAVQFRHRLDALEITADELWHLATKQISKQLHAIQQQRQQSIRKTKTKETSTSLIPIHIRLSLHGVRVHDDFDWDPELLSAIEMAKSIGQDLQLSDELVQAISIDITEQQFAYYYHHQNKNSASTDNNSDDNSMIMKIVTEKPTTTGFVVNNDNNDNDPAPKQNENITAAWKLLENVHVTNVAHLVSQHNRPPQHQHQQHQHQQP